MPVGTHALTARVTDSRGAVGMTAATVTFSVTQDPALTLPAPTITHSTIPGPMNTTVPTLNASLVTISMPVPAANATDAERKTFLDRIRGAWILYTVATRDGNKTLVALDPATDKTAQYYTSPFLVGLGEHIVAARLFKDGYAPSPEATDAFTVVAGPVTAAPGVRLESLVGRRGGTLVTRGSDLYLADATVTEPTVVRATATGQASWHLEYRLVGEDGSPWTPFAEGVGDLASTTDAGVFDPTLLPNGTYELAIQGYNAAGVADPAYRDVATVVVDGGMKIGNMSFSVVDMTVQVGGFPITMTRTYDSRDTIRKKTGGDFGVGWSLSIAGVKVQKSGSLATGWTYRGTGLGLTVAPFRSHVITVTTADGRTYSFAPTLVPDTILLTELRTGHVDYAAVGTTPRGTTLVAVAGDGTALSNKVYLGDASGPTAFTLYQDDGTDFFGAVYDPTAFQMTLRSGTTLVLDSSNAGGSGRGSGLLSIIDRNGNHLDFTPGGITSYSPSGVAQRSVVITRPGGVSGYITAIRDPNGKSIHYDQSDGGDLTAVTNRVGDVTRYTYDGRHFVTGIIDPRGIQPIRNIYDAAGRLVQTIDALGKSVTFDHNLGAGLETVTDRMNYITRTGYDGYGNVTRVEKPITVYVNGVAQAAGAAISSDTEYSTDPTNYEKPVSVTVHPTTSGADDRTSRMIYDGDGNLTHSFDALNHETQYFYNPYGQPLSVIDPLKRVTVTNTYDIKGNPQSSTDALHHTTTSVYNPDTGRLTSMTDALSHATLMRYDFDTGRVTGVTDALGHGMGFVYDANGNRTGTQTNRTKADGTVETLTTKTVYDDEDRVVQTIAPDGSTSRTVYNEIGRVAAHYDLFNRVTTYLYDELGRQMRATRPDGIVSATAYDDDGRVAYSGSQRVRQDGSLGMLYSRSLYDEAGRSYGGELWDGIPGASGSTMLAHSFANINLASEFLNGLDAVGHATGNTVYDKIDRPMQSIDSLGGKTAVYDVADQVMGMTDAMGHSSTITYDDNRRAITSTSPVAKISTEYDAIGRRTSGTDGSGRTTQFGYDELDRLSAVIEAGGHRTTYIYDELGNKISQTDDNGHTTNFSYDSMGRMTGRHLPLGQSETITYLIDGRLGTKTDFNGTVTTFTYDDDFASTVPASQRMGRLVRRVSGGGTATIVRSDGATITRPIPSVTVYYSYYLDGSRSGITKVTGSKTTRINYVYDIRGRLVTVYNYVGSGTIPTSTLTYTYDDNGNKTSVNKIDSNNVVVWQVGYGYDLLNRLQYVYHQGGAVTTYVYNRVGNRIKTIRARVDGSVIASTAYGYDDGDRLTSVTNSTGSSFTYTLDGAGRRIGVTDSIRGPTAYTYDGLGRLVNESGFAGNITYGYDKVGNRLSKAVSNAPGGTGNGTTAYEYDANDRLQKETSPASTVLYGYDPNGALRLKSEGVVGNPAAVTNTLFDFDAEDKLYDTYIGTGDATQASGYVRRTDYVYDPEGNRVEKTVWAVGSNGIGAGTVSDYTIDTTAYYAQVIEERKTAPGGAVTTTRFDFGLDIARLTRDGGTYYYLFDGQGSVVGLVDPATGNVIYGSGYTFDAFGMPVAGSVGENSDLQPFLGVGGQQFDSELGLYYLRARYYAPSLGRFLSQDPFSGYDLQPSTLNRYRYAGNDPLNFVDPSGNVDTLVGLAWTSGIGAVLGGVGGGIHSIATTGKLQLQSVIFGAAVGGIAGAGGYGLGALVALSTVTTSAAVSISSGLVGTLGLAWLTAWGGASYASGIAQDYAILTSNSSQTQKNAAEVDIFFNVFTARVAPHFIPGLLSGQRVARAQLENGRQIRCFTKGTKVRMKDGKVRNIETIKIGDMVLTDDPKSSTAIALHRVIGVTRGHAYRVYHVVFRRSGMNRGEVIATGSHPFWVASSKKWVLARYLHIKDVLQDEHHHPVYVTKVWEELRSCNTYNLAVEKSHTYFVVSNGTSVLVHNINPWEIRHSRDPSEISLTNTFYDGPWAGRTLEEAVVETRRRNRLADGLELFVDRIIRPSGEEIFVAANNRTLWVAQTADLANVNPDIGSNFAYKTVQDHFNRSGDNGGGGWDRWELERCD